MTWPSWVIALGLLILKLWRGKGYRATVEVRSEASIDADRKRLDGLAARIKGIDNELQETVIKLVAAQKAEREARKAHDTVVWDKAHRDWVALDGKRQRLLGQLGAARQAYIDARGVPDL